MTLAIDRIHHVAYRGKDAQDTVLWYGQMPKMGCVLAIAANEMPSAKAANPYMQELLS